MVIESGCQGFWIRHVTCDRRLMLPTLGFQPLANSFSTCLLVGIPSTSSQTHGMRSSRGPANVYCCSLNCKATCARENSGSTFQPREVAGRTGSLHDRISIFVPGLHVIKNVSKHMFETIRLCEHSKFSKPCEFV